MVARDPLRPVDRAIRKDLVAGLVGRERAEVVRDEEPIVRILQTVLVEMARHPTAAPALERRREARRLMKMR